MFAIIPAALAVTVIVLSTSDNVSARFNGPPQRRGESDPLPLWNNAPSSPVTHRNKGDRGDIDPRGSVRYNIGMNGRVMKGIIMRHREVPTDDEGGGVEQAKEECCFQDSY